MLILTVVIPKQATSKSSRALPSDLDYMAISTLSMESREKLTKVSCTAHPLVGALHVPSTLAMLDCVQWSCLQSRSEPAIR